MHQLLQYRHRFGWQNKTIPINEVPIPVCSSDQDKAKPHNTDTGMFIGPRRGQAAQYRYRYVHRTKTRPSRTIPIPVCSSDQDEAKPHNTDTSMLIGPRQDQVVQCYIAVFYQNHKTSAIRIFRNSSYN